MNPYRTRFHRDGSVTYWDVMDQRWRRLAANLIQPAALATLSEADRRRIGKAARRQEGA